MMSLKYSILNTPTQQYFMLLTEGSKLVNYDQCCVMYYLYQLTMASVVWVCRSGQWCKNNPVNLNSQVMFCDYLLICED